MEWSSARLAGLLAAVLVAACGGGEVEPPPAGTPAQAAPPAAPPAEDPPAGQAAAGGEAVPPSTDLVREVFSYGGAGRDPFLPLTSEATGPAPRDVRVAGITYDPRFPNNSVAVLRDTVVGRRYTIRVGDVLGRMRVAEIRPQEIVVVVEEFGVERQEILRQRRRQEEIP